MLRLDGAYGQGQPKLYLERAHKPMGRHHDGAALGEAHVLNSAVDRLRGEWMEGAPNVCWVPISYAVQGWIRVTKGLRKQTVFPTRP